MIRRTLALLAALLWAAPALAQPVNLPANSVWGRLGIGTGPGQAIPITSLIAQFSAVLGGVSVTNPGTGALEVVYPIQTVTGASKVFATADLFRLTQRSNAGSAMSDTFPASTATGVANGTSIIFSNVDASATATITAGAGTTINGGATDTVGPGRTTWYVYDVNTTKWVGAFNTGSALLGPNNLSDVANVATARANLAVPLVTRNISTGCGLSGGGDLSADRTLRLSLTINAQTGTSYTVVDGDCGKLVSLSNASPVAVTLPQANGSTFVSGWSVDFQNKGAGTATITPTTSTVNGASTLILTQNQGAHCDSDGTNYTCMLGVGAGGGAGTVTSVVAGTGLTGGTITSSGTITAPISMPQGRLTLLTGNPVMATSQSAKGTLFYDCYAGNAVPYFNGSIDTFDTISGCEVSDAMVSAASAGQVVSGQVYDVFWVHGGANRICVAMSASTGGGGGWASDTGGSSTARGTGYSAVDLTRGYWTNTNSITNCFNGATNYGTVAAHQGTYLGTFFATANGQTSYVYGFAAAGGGQAQLYLWNAYNRVAVHTTVSDSNAFWSYALAPYRNSDGSTNTRVSWVTGLAIDSFSANIFGEMSSVTIDAISDVALAIDVSNSQAPECVALVVAQDTAGVGHSTGCEHGYAPVVGVHFVQGLDGTDGTTSSNFLSNQGGAFRWGLTVRGLMQ